ncbi:MAG: DUF805 domain-containing protein [Fuscovulum sp.]|nr:DUF805 domain-containing protein [Fuscovulum sp.]
MGPGTALVTALRRAFDFSGRATRAEFWWAWLILYVWATLVMLYRGLPSTGPRTDALLTIVVCAIAVPMIAVGTRRLIDAGFWRWLFLLTVLLGTLQQLVYYFAMPSPMDFAMMNFMAERNDVNLPLSGYELRHLLLAVRDDVLPWTGRICAVLCLILALFPSRRTPRQTGPSPSEVTP